MKKLIALLLLGTLTMTVFAGEDSTTPPGKKNNAPNFTITKHWELNPVTHWAYYIENPTHAELNLAFEIYPWSMSSHGIVPSSAIKLTCGDQVFYVTEYSPTGMTVCKTTDEIHFELVSPPGKGNPSNGKFVLQQ